MWIDNQDSFKDSKVFSLNNSTFSGNMMKPKDCHELLNDLNQLKRKMIWKVKNSNENFQVQPTRNFKKKTIRIVNSLDI